MPHSYPKAAFGRPMLIAAVLIPLGAGLTGCGGDSSSSSGPQVYNGTFVDSPVASLDYRGENTSASLTDRNGRFQYRGGETLTFAIGELVLGQAAGAEVVTPLDVTEGAANAQDPAVINRLVLLQSLDADGDLNNGIQITEGIRAEVSANAGDLNFSLTPEDFSAALQPVLDALEAGDQFTDRDPIPRSVVAATDASEHFERSISPRKIVRVEQGELRGFEASPDRYSAGHGGRCVPHRDGFPDRAAGHGGGLMLTPNYGSISIKITPHNKNMARPQIAP